MIDLSGLDRALAALQNALRIYDGNPLPEDAPEKVVIRDGVIQRFEIAFELSWKMLRRHLETYGLERVDTLGNRDLFRVGQEQALLGDAGRWFFYLKMRNQTSHVYDDAKAHEVFSAAREFLPDAQALLTRLRARAQ
jgi:nucleotidyltransferase substrate binding protein (TIGR01987 family)